MDIITVNNNTLDAVKLVNPESSKGVLFCDVVNGSSGLFIQTPKLHYELNDGFTFMFSNEKKSDSVAEFYNLIKGVEDKICHLLADVSGEWFSDVIDFKTIKDKLFKSILTLPKNYGDDISFDASIPYDKDVADVEVFDTSKNQLDFEIFSGDPPKEVTALLSVRELVIKSNQATLKWEVVQVLVHKKKKTHNIKGFGIRAAPDEKPLEKLQIGIVDKPEPVESFPDDNTPKTESLPEPVEPDDNTPKTESLPDVVLVEN